MVKNYVYVFVNKNLEFDNTRTFQQSLYIHIHCLNYFNSSSVVLISYIKGVSQYLKRIRSNVSLYLVSYIWLVDAFLLPLSPCIKEIFQETSVVSITNSYKWFCMKRFSVKTLNNRNIYIYIYLLSNKVGKVRNRPTN